MEATCQGHCVTSQGSCRFQRRGSCGYLPSRSQLRSESQHRGPGWEKLPRPWLGDAEGPVLACEPQPSPRTHPENQWCHQGQPTGGGSQRGGALTPGQGRAAVPCSAVWFVLLLGIIQEKKMCRNTGPLKVCPLLLRATGHPLRLPVSELNLAAP